MIYNSSNAINELGPPEDRRNSLYNSIYPCLRINPNPSETLNAVLSKQKLITLPLLSYPIPSKPIIPSDNIKRK
jgi:hypothetical protein